ncbi:MAG: fimbrillin family protein [Candidatus Cryptobacteroides sp.]
MKKSYLILAAAMVLAVSCAKEQSPSASNEPVLVAKTFTAGGPQTRTSLSGKQVLWTEGDKISVFDNQSNKNNAFESSNQKGNSALFSGYVTEGATEYVAVYPYKSGTTFDSANMKITTAFPIIQKAVKGGFDTNVNLMYAVSEGETLEFKNVCALMKVTIPEGVNNSRPECLPFLLVPQFCLYCRP